MRNPVSRNLPGNLSRVLSQGCVAMMALLPLACSGGSTPTSDEVSGGGSGNGPGLLLRNAAVHTVNPAQPNAQAIVIKGGKITFVGSNTGADALVESNTVVLDLAGRSVLPGIHDIHMHPLEAGSEVATTCLLNSAEEAEDQVAVIQACAPNQRGTEWVLGGGHSIFDLLETARLPVEILGDAVPNHPAIMLEETSHSVWANSEALAAAGITAATADPLGGVIDKDPDSGEPSGLLIDNAGNLLFHQALSPRANRPQLSELNYSGLLWALGELSKNGITSISDARTYWQRDHIQVWRRAESENELTVRVALGLWAYPEDSDATQIAQLRALYEDDPNALLKINQIKFYSDGIVHNGTAALLAPYDETPGFTGNTGLNYFTPARLQQYIAALEPVGFTMNIHAIGDRGVREALNAIAGAAAVNGAMDRRHRITHVELVDPADIPRFAQLGVIADAQVAGDFAQSGMRDDLIENVGNQRAQRQIPLADLAAANARITLSSDWDVSSLSPFVGMENAISRGAQSLPNLAAAVRAYTLDAAYAMKQEDRVGSLEVGKDADLIVLDRDLFAIPVSQISETQVLLTLLGGEETWRAENF